MIPVNSSLSGKCSPLYSNLSTTTGNSTVYPTMPWTSRHRLVLLTSLRGLKDLFFKLSLLLVEISTYQVGLSVMICCNSNHIRIRPWTFSKSVFVHCNVLNAYGNERIANIFSVLTLFLSKRFDFCTSFIRHQLEHYLLAEFLGICTILPQS